jgi:LacI family transcriptional regulator
MKTSNNATIRDVARRAGVSVATISRYLNDTAPLAAETAQRVKLAMEELNFTPHPIARNLATKRTNTLGLLLLDIGGNYYTPMLRGIEAASSDAGYDLLIHSTRTQQSGNRLRRALNEHNTDGLLVFIDALDVPELTRLNSIGFPVVMMHQSAPPTLDIPVVTIENQSGAFQIVNHLITAHDRKRIVFLRGPANNEDSHFREMGYRQALKENGIEADPALITTGRYESEDARKAITDLLARNVRFDAIFTGDDDSAIGVLDALKQAGLSVPGDVSIAGFDNSIFSNLLTPPLTTVSAPIEDVGREAVRQLIHLIRGEEAEPRIVMPTEMILRQSCGCK